MFYVNMHDTFMSGWGPAQGKRNILSIACDTYAQACSIEQAARRRSEMRRISISSKPPRPRNALVSRKTFADMGGSWREFYQVASGWEECR